MELNKNKLEEDKLLEYTFSLITLTPPKLLVEKYQKYKNLSEVEKKTGLLSPYFFAEEFILNHKPPAVKAIYTQVSLREDIAKHINMQQLKPEVRIFFMPETQQRFYLYEICVGKMSDLMIQKIGLTKLSEIVTLTTKSTTLSQAAVTQKGINFNSVNETVGAVPLPQIIADFKKLYNNLYQEAYLYLGETAVLEIMRATFQFLQKTYDFTLTSYFFDIVPDGVLENERISFMSRDSLEQRVLQRTKELEDAKVNLEEKVAQRTKELAEEKQKVETILKSIGDAVFAVDLKCQIILMNKIAEELSGYTLDESVGKYYSQIFRFIHEDEPNVPYEPFVEDVIKTRKTHELKSHTLIVARNGKRISISDSAAPIMTHDGDIAGCVVVFRDASQERELERAKDTFISIAAHQLRTPLGSIRWNIEMLLDGDMGELSPSVKETIEHVYENDKRLITLVNDLLNVSRIDQKKVPYEPASVNIMEVIRDAGADLEAEMRKREVSIHIHGPVEKEILLTLDKKRFREVIENLVSNAVKYNKQKGVVDINIVQNNNAVTITIADQGIGIPETDKGSIFSKFFRAQNALKSETEGTGLGLFVVKSFVENLGGTVWFESVEGKGTSFFIKLPVK